MYDLAAIAIFFACFAFVFLSCLWVDGARLMAAGDSSGSSSRCCVLAYLVYALFRGERF